MPQLYRERCQACTGETPLVEGEELATLLTELDRGWSVQQRRLRRRLEFPNFAAAFTLATRIALLAEREGHHPELRVGWGYLELELFTHAVGGLTRNDLILAAKIDRAAAAAAQPEPPSAG
ncbi:MAG: 4a-hydroxytetrahydrobiopterin dehydratase [Candidatus Dormibacteria bacterium]